MEIFFNNILFKYCLILDILLVKVWSQSLINCENQVNSFFKNGLNNNGLNFREIPDKSRENKYQKIYRDLKAHELLEILLDLRNSEKQIEDSKSNKVKKILNYNAFEISGKDRKTPNIKPIQFERFDEDFDLINTQRIDSNQVKEKPKENLWSKVKSTLRGKLDKSVKEDNNSTFKKYVNKITGIFDNFKDVKSNSTTNAREVFLKSGGEILYYNALSKESVEGSNQKEKTVKMGEKVNDLTPKKIIGAFLKDKINKLKDILVSTTTTSSHALDSNIDYFDATDQSTGHVDGEWRRMAAAVRAKLKDRYLRRKAEPSLWREVVFG